MRKYWVVFTNTLQKALVYRARTFTWAFINTAQPLIMIAVWVQYYQSGRTLNGQSLDEIIGYYLLVIFMGMWTSKMNEHVDEDIRDGNLSNYVIKPFNYSAFRIAWESGWYVVKTVPFIIPLMVVLYHYAQPAFHNLIDTHVFGVFARLGVFVLGYLISFYLSMIVGATSFFITDSGGITHVYRMLGELVTGKVLPLSLFPPLLLGVINSTPFPYTLSFPVRVLAGQATRMETVVGLGIQIIWLSILYLVFTALWKKGIKKFSAVGL